MKEYFLIFHYTPKEYHTDSRGRLHYKKSELLENGCVWLYAVSLGPLSSAEIETLEEAAYIKINSITFDFKGKEQTGYFTICTSENEGSKKAKRLRALANFQEITETRSDLKSNFWTRSHATSEPRDDIESLMLKCKSVANVIREERRSQDRPALLDYDVNDSSMLFAAASGRNAVSKIPIEVYGETEEIYPTNETLEVHVVNTELSPGDLLIIDHIKRLDNYREPSAIPPNTPDESKGRWVSQREAMEMYSLSKKALENYREKERCKWIADDGLSGIDEYGHWWRRKAPNSPTEYFIPDGCIR